MRSVAEGAVEMITQLAANFTLEGVFEQAQHETQFSQYMNLLAIYFYGSGDSSAIEMDGVIFPTVVYGKFFCQALGQFISRVLRVFTVHLMRGMNVDCGHSFHNLRLAESSLVPVASYSQSNAEFAA